jgi:hypothetical protein
MNPQPANQSSGKIIIRFRNLGDTPVSMDQHNSQALPTARMEPALPQATSSISRVASLLNPRRSPRERKHRERPEDRLSIPTSLGEIQPGKMSIVSNPSPTSKRTGRSDPTVTKTPDSISEEGNNLSSLSQTSHSPLPGDEPNQLPSSIDDGHAPRKRRRVDSPTWDRPLPLRPRKYYELTTIAVFDKYKFTPSSALTGMEVGIQCTRLKGQQEERDETRDGMRNAADALMSLHNEDSTLDTTRMEEEALERQIANAQSELSDIVRGKITRGALAAILDKKKGGNELYRRTLGFYLESLQWWQSHHPDVQELRLPSTKDLKASDSAVQIGDIYEVLRRAAVCDMRQRILDIGRSERLLGQSGGKLSALWWRLFEKWSLPEDEAAHCTLSKSN